MSASEAKIAGPAPGWVVDGRYRLESQIGEGGVAVVWRAQHLRLDQPVAIKLLREDGEKEKGRFLREAKVASAVKHRNVVQIMDFGVFEGVAYMVMELLEGRPLSSIMEGLPLGVGDSVRWTAQALGGLAAVHDAHMAHRDIKPENIFLVEDADGVYPKIVDFGLSKNVGLHRDSSTAHLKSVIPTSENLITGTPEYMSPEQARGRQDIDVRTDVWSMGVVLFELLTGKQPFGGEAVGDLLLAIMTEDAPRLTDIRADLGGELSDFIAKCLARDPNDRFSNARAMRHGLMGAAANLAESLEHRDPATSAQLFDATGAALEPGDSGMIQIAHLRQRLDTHSGVSPRASAADIPGMSSKPGKTWMFALLALLLVGGIAAFAFSGGESEEIAETNEGVSESAAGQGETTPAPPVEVEELPPAPVMQTLTLTGVPEGARVLLDGEAHEGTSFEFELDDASHEIEVSLAGHRTWSVEHRAAAGAETSYHVELTPVPAAPSQMRPTGMRRRPSMRNLFRDPGF